MVGDSAGGHFADPRDLGNGLSGFEFFEGIELGAVERAFCFHFRRGRTGERIEALFFVGGEVGFDFLHESLAVVIELLGADSGDVEKIRFGLRVTAGHVAERSVTENDVGRDGFFVGDGFAKDAERLE